MSCSLMATGNPASAKFSTMVNLGCLLLEASLEFAVMFFQQEVSRRRTQRSLLHHASLLLEPFDWRQQVLVAARARAFRFPRLPNQQLD